jgi:hypothetical protein
MTGPFIKSLLYAARWPWLTRPFIRDPSLEHAVHEFGLDFFGVQALGQLQRPRELPRR